jgi:hypothetical protein
MIDQTTLWFETILIRRTRTLTPSFATIQRIASVLTFCEPFACCLSVPRSQREGTPWDWKTNRPHFHTHVSIP